MSVRKTYILWILFGLLVYVVFTGKALACDIFTPPLGESLQRISAQYNLDAVGSESSRRVQISAHGNRVCGLLASGAQVHFTFFYGTLVTVQIEHKGSGGALLQLAETQFGTAENRPNALHPKRKLFQNVWRNNDQLVLYSAHMKEGEEREYLEITSRRHHALMARVYREEEQGITPLGAR